MVLRIKSMFRGIHFFVQIALAILVFFAISPALAEVESTMGILTLPESEEGILYFAGWGDILYAFDEVSNEEKWALQLEPVRMASEVVPRVAPPPQLYGLSLIHI